ncbi:hypothetical protein IFR05_013188 [Cadophora sp. M221]|nr:hypothetical protein IFR05_013188 [Cadophora sp. M221]
MLDDGDGGTREDNQGNLKSIDTVVGEGKKKVSYCGLVLTTMGQTLLSQIISNFPSVPYLLLTKSCSIVAVHGLQGDFEGTWEEGGHIWLRDFLGDLIPDIQVLSFGYNSLVYSPGWTNQLEDFARQLLQAVKNHRNDSDRVGFSVFLHGIALEALIMAHAKSYAFSNILEHTKGLIFMGTPHRGADPAKWASMLQSILGPIRAGPSTALYSDLKEKSRTLMQINDDFPERAEDLNQILSFYELAVQPGLGTVVVERSSALMNLANEIPIALNANHRSMCRFARADDPGFETVWKPIRDMVQLIRDGGTRVFKEQRRALLAKLCGNNFVNFSSPSIDPAEGTCSWILNHSMYSEWQTKPLYSSLLWITGGPGSGKSVLSDFVVKELKNSTALVCDFAFTEGKSSIFDLLGRVITQALLANDELCHIAIENRQIEDGAVTWHSLCSLWTKVCEDAKGGDIFWVVDALDECNELENAKGFLNMILILLGKLNSIAQPRLSFRVLVTSRPETWRQLWHASSSEITIKNRIILEDEAAIEDDINAYIHEEVAKLTPQYIQEDERSKLETQLCARAFRSFIWVKLTLKSIQTELAYNEGTWDVIIDAIPNKLEETYEKLLSQLSGAKSTTRKPGSLPPRIRRLLQFVVGAHGFLTVSELSILFALEDQPATVELVESKSLSSEHFFETVYGSFLRLVRGLDGVQQVRLIHETARKHLLLPESKSNYALELDGCHLELANGCISYLALDDLDDYVSNDLVEPFDSHPLLKYAVLQWASHVRESEHKMDDETLGRVLDMYRTNSQRFASWSGAYWALSSKGQGKSSYTPLQMCAYNGHLRALRRLLENLDSQHAQEEIDKVDSAGDTALHYATECGGPSAVEVLLDAKADPSIRNNAGLAPLHKAVFANDFAVVDALVRGGANIDIRTAGEKFDRTVLHMAAEDGLQEMVEKLVRNGANLQIRDSVSSTAAAIAFRKGFGEIYKFLLTEESQEIDSGITELDQAIIDGDLEKVRQLLVRRSFLTMPDTRGSTPLHRAARAGGSEVLKLLLENTGDPEIRDDDLMTPLHIAAKYGRRDAVEILISRNANRNSTCADKSTPLHQAALAGNKIIVDRLLDARADQSLVDDKDRTPLFCASSLGFNKIVESLLRKASTSKIELVGDDETRLPIHIAAKNGHTSTVRALFNRNSASIEIQDHNGSTPLSLAARGPSKNHAETVKFLVENGANISHKQRNGSTPIILAAENGNVQSMKYLLGEGCQLPGKEPANLDERNSGRSTALSLAAKNGHEDAVLLLLSHGAQDVSKRESPGRRDPISWAAGHGMLEAVKKLQSIPNILTDAFDKEDRTPLSWAAGNGHTAVVRQLLLPSDRTTPAAAVNSIDTSKRTPLSWAAGAGHKEVVQVLLSHHADQNIRGKNTASPIVWAAKAGQLEVLKILLGENPPEETMLSEDGGSLLLVAAANGKADVVSFLLQQPGTDVNKTDKNGRTPLIHTALGGHEDVALMLLQHHADVHQRTNQSGATALTVAASWGRLEIIKLLLAHDKSTLQVTTDEEDNTPLYLAVQGDQYETVNFLLQSGCSVDAGSRDSDTLAHVAARGGHFLVLKALLEHARHLLNAKNSNRKTPLLLAAENSHELCVVVILECCRKWDFPPSHLLVTDVHNRSILSAAATGGNSKIVQYLLDIDPRKSDTIRKVDHRGYTPLTYAMKFGSNLDADVLQLLLRHSPKSINQRVPAYGTTLLLWAAKRGHEDMLRIILECPNVDRYAKDKTGCNSLWLAVNSGDFRSVSMLLEDERGEPRLRKIWVNQLDISNSFSPLQLAVNTGFLEIVELLLMDKDTEVNKASPDGTTAFLTAVIAGDEPVVRTLADNPAVDTTVTNCDGYTALMLACENCHLKIVRFLLNEHRIHPIDVDATDRRMKTALCHAARAKEPAIVKLLLDSNASVHRQIPPYNRNPSMLAVESGCFGVVKMFITHGGLDLNATDDNGYTVLTLAAVMNHGNIVRLLLNEGADPNVRSTRSQRTPLMEAAYVGSAAAIRELLLCPRIDYSCVNDADRTATWFIINGPQDESWASNNNSKQYLSTEEIFLEFESNTINVNEVDIEGLTPLILLAGRASKHLQVRRLLELGADLQYQSLATRTSAFHAAAASLQIRTLNELLEFSMGNDMFDSKDLDNATPLSYAAGNFDPSGANMYAAQAEVERYRAVRILLDRKPEVNSTTRKQKVTPLMFAARLGFEHVVGLLLEHGADVKLRDREYCTPLSLAVIGGHTGTVLRLLDAGAPYGMKDKTGATLLILAAERGHSRIVRLLLEPKYLQSVNHRDRSGRTALSYAAQHNRLPVVHYLLDCHNPKEAPIIDTLDRQDQTALVWACKAGNCAILGVLIAQGANFRCGDRNKRMPLSHAAENGRIDIVRQLLVQEDESGLPQVINWSDDSGRTALSWAAEAGQLEVTRVLLEWGANALLSDKKKQTPHLLAKDKGHEKVAKILEAHVASVLREESLESMTRNQDTESSHGSSHDDANDDTLIGEEELLFPSNDLSLTVSTDLLLVDQDAECSSFAHDPALVSEMKPAPTSARCSKILLSPDTPGQLTQRRLSL